MAGCENIRYRCNLYLLFFPILFFFHNIPIFYFLSVLLQSFLWRHISFSLVLIFWLSTNFWSHSIRVFELKKEGVALHCLHFSIAILVFLRRTVYGMKIFGFRKSSKIWNTWKVNSCEKSSRYTEFRVYLHYLYIEEISQQKAQPSFFVLRKKTAHPLKYRRIWKVEAIVKS